MAPDDGRVVSNFVLQALRGEPLTIYGDGTQTRSFCYVSDLVDGFVKLMDNDKNLVGPVSLGNPGEFTMNELAEAVMDVTGSSSSIEYKPLPEDDPKQRRHDISLATQELGWEPIVQLREGLDHTVRYFRSLLAE